MKLDIIKIDLSKFRNDDSIRSFFKEHNIEISKTVVRKLHNLSMDDIKFLFLDLNTMGILCYVSIEDYKTNKNNLDDQDGCTKTLLEKYYANPNILSNEDEVIKNNPVVTKIENNVSTKVNKDEHTDKKHLELKLQECIECEDYLEAAKIRDIIKDL